MSIYRCTECEQMKDDDVELMEKGLCPACEYKDSLIHNENDPIIDPRPESVGCDPEYEEEG